MFDKALYTIQMKKCAHSILLALVLTIGIALRLVYPTWVEFKRDEATVARLGQAIAHEGYRPAVGVDSSLGIDNLPLTLYLMAFPLLFWSDPLAAVIFTAVLNSLALVACYILARAALGRRAALIATALFAVSPWAVLYARKIWPRTLPLFTLAFIGTLYLTFVRGKRGWLVGAFAALAGLLGLQLEAIAFIPLFLAILVLYRDELAWRPLVLGVGLFLLLMGPYAIHDARHNWANLRGLIGYAAGDSRFSWDAIRYAFSLLGGEGIWGEAGAYHEQFRQALPPLWWFNDLLAVLLVLALGYAVYQALRGATRDRRRTFTLMLLWFALPILLQLKPSTPTQRHYYVMHYPVQFMLIGSFVTAVIDGVLDRVRPHHRVRIRRALTYGVLGLIVMISAWQIAVTAQLRAYMMTYPLTGGYGIPLHYSRRASQAAVRLLAAPGGDDGESEIIVLGESVRPFMTETPTVLDALLFGTPHRFVDGRGALVFPEADRVVYLSGPMDEDAAHPLSATVARLRSLPTVAPGPKIEIADGWHYATFMWYGTARDGVVAGMQPLAEGIPFANNVVFAACEAASPLRGGTTLEVWLAWWMRGPSVSQDDHFTVQVLDGQNRLMSQDDHAAFPSDTWQAGDLVLSRFNVPVPEVRHEVTYTLRAGMYGYPEVAVVPVIDVDGAAIDDGVTLGEVIVMP